MAKVDASAATRSAGRNDGLTIMAAHPACCDPDDSRSAVPETARCAVQAVALCAGLLCTAIPPAHAETIAPFPLAGVPDYVVTMVEHGRNNEITSTITPHDQWTRIDTIDGQLHTSRYFSPGGPTEIKITRRLSDDAIEGRFVRGTEHPWDYTGELQALLRENCTVWNVRRERDGPSAKLSCVTDDGTELSHRYTGGSNGSMFAAEVTRVERRPVAASDVEPPRDLFTPSWWLNGATIAGDTATTADYESVMRQIGGLRRDLVRTTRRHDPWTYVEETARDQWRQLRVTSATHRFDFTAADPRFGRPQRLLIFRSLRDGLASSIAKALDQHDTLFGERCDWFDTMPSAMDAGQLQCRTTHGIVLKERNFSWGSEWDLIATRLSRRPISLAEVTLPANLLSPKFWGLD
jgi:hypothetical protein